MSAIGQLDQLAKSYGFSVALLILVCAVLCTVAIQLYRENQKLNGKLLELLDTRGKFLDSILTEAIHEKTHKANS